MANTKKLQVFGSIKGTDGKSAYEYAKDGGYTGTEEEFSNRMATKIPVSFMDLEDNGNIVTGNLTYKVDYTFFDETVTTSDYVAEILGNMFYGVKLSDDFVYNRFYNYDIMTFDGEEERYGGYRVSHSSMYGTTYIGDESTLTGVSKYDTGFFEPIIMNVSGVYGFGNYLLFREPYDGVVIIRINEYELTIDKSNLPSVSYNDLTNLYFYEHLDTIPIVNETRISTKKGVTNVGNIRSDLFEYAKARITINTTSYIMDINSTGGNQYYIGNYSLVNNSYENTGENLCFCVSISESSGNRSYTLYLDTNVYAINSSVKLSVEGITDIYIEKLPERFLPDTAAKTDQVLTKTNTIEYTPTEDYHPVTKKYVDDKKLSDFEDDINVVCFEVTEETELLFTITNEDCRYWYDEAYYHDVYLGLLPDDVMDKLAEISSTDEIYYTRTFDGIDYEKSAEDTVKFDSKSRVKHIEFAEPSSYYLSNVEFQYTPYVDSSLNYTYNFRYFTQAEYSSDSTTFSFSFYRVKKTKTIDADCIDTTIPRVNTAEVGQMIIVKAVDDNGVPTEWEAVDKASGSWNDLTDKPFGESGEEVWVLDKTSLIFAGESSNSLEVSDEVVQLFTTAGNKVYVYWNGVIHECEVQYHNVAMYYYISFGNYTAFLEGNTLTLEFGETMIGAFEFGLLSSVAELKQLDEKYIPETIARKEDIPENTDVPENVLTYSEQSLTEEQKMQARKNLGLYYSEEVAITEDVFSYVYVGWWEVTEDNLSNTNITNKQYLVTLLDNTYEVYGKSRVTKVNTVSITQGLFWIGNPTLIDNVPSNIDISGETDYTDLPFVVYWNKVNVDTGNGEMIGSPTVVLDPSVSTSMMGQGLFIETVKGEETVHTTIPKEFIPILYDYIILNSSDESGKQFKITVNDEGTLTATEITD